MDQSKQLKFPDGSKTEVTIVSMEMEENDYGSTYVVHIKETIEGYNHFKPSDGLIDKMKKENVDKGDTIVIEKVAPSEKYKYGYFGVEMAQNPPTTTQDKVVMDQQATGEIKAVEPTQKDDSMAIHELTVRVEALESEVLKLKKDALPF